MMRRPEWLRPRWPVPDGDDIVDDRGADDLLDMLDAMADERDQLEADEEWPRITCDWFDIEEDP